MVMHASFIRSDLPGRQVYGQAIINLGSGTLAASLSQGTNSGTQGVGRETDGKLLTGTLRDLFQPPVKNHYRHENHTLTKKHNHQKKALILQHYSLLKRNSIKSQTYTWIIHGSISLHNLSLTANQELKK